MARSRIELTEVMSILKNALGDDLVDKETFCMYKDGEKINYWQGDYNKLNSPVRYIIGNRGNKLQEIEAFNKSIKNGDKAFLFYRIDGCDEYLFSFEFMYYESGQMDILNGTELDKLRKSNDEIVRIQRGNYGFMVAIKIGGQTNRDYSALKHYIISSDNRTYNKVVRNMVEYITVDSQQSKLENTTELPHNLLISGAPGTGKSHYLDVQTKKAGGVSFDEKKGKYDLVPGSFIYKMKENDDSNKSDDSKMATAIRAYCDVYVTRVTFYEDYSYENFIGCYKPVPEECTANIEYGGQNGTITENRIAYRFVSGPFIDTYVKAKKDPDHSYYLIIEELNRAKAASVFGDMFQLLDRKKGMSEYEIKPEATLNDYLKEQLKDKYSGMMKLPCNMYLWATMNSADQGVMPLDSAFKRRWAQMYMDINPQEGSAREDKLIMPSKEGMKFILWENLRSSINSVILSKGFDEDRCIGSWYFSSEEIGQINEYFTKQPSERINMVNPLIDKLLYYLRQDLFRINPGQMFKHETEDTAGISMSDLRRRVRQGHSIDTILKLESLKWESIEKNSQYAEDDTNSQINKDSDVAPAN